MTSSVVPVAESVVKAPVDGVVEPIAGGDAASKPAPNSTAVPPLLTLRTWLAVPRGSVVIAPEVVVTTGKPLVEPSVPVDERFPWVWVSTARSFHPVSVPSETKVKDWLGAVNVASVAYVTGRPPLTPVAVLIDRVLPVNKPDEATSVTTSPSAFPL